MLLEYVRVMIFLVVLIMSLVLFKIICSLIAKKMNKRYEGFNRFEEENKRLEKELEKRRDRINDRIM